MATAIDNNLPFSLAENPLPFIITILKVNTWPSFFNYFKLVPFFSSRCVFAELISSSEWNKSVPRIKKAFPGGT